MSTPDRNLELIQRFLDARASDAEIAELEKLLAADSEFANVFADAARLHAGLERQFRQQYKIAQVAKLLDSPERPHAEKTTVPASRAASAFVPAPAKLVESRLARFTSARQFARPRGNPWRRGAIAAAVLLLAIGAAYWSLHRPESDGLRLLSGHVAVAGQEVAGISEDVLFEVTGPGPAAIQLPGGSRAELTVATQALVRRDASVVVVQIASGGGELDVSHSPSAVRVETVLGTITTTGSRFSLEVATAPPRDFSPTAPLSLPSLTIAVLEGSVTVEYHGVSTIVSAGEVYVFPRPT